MVSANQSTMVLLYRCCGFGKVAGLAEGDGGETEEMGETGGDGGEGEEMEERGGNVCHHRIVYL
jgi:hypothetical protein